MTSSPITITPTVVELPKLSSSIRAPSTESEIGKLYSHSAEDLTEKANSFVADLDRTEATFQAAFDEGTEKELMHNIIVIGIIALAILTALAIGIATPFIGIPLIATVIVVAICAAIAFGGIFKFGSTECETNKENSKLLTSIKNTKNALKQREQVRIVNGERIPIKNNTKITDMPFFTFIHDNFMIKLKKPAFKAIDLCPMHQIYLMPKGKKQNKAITALLLNLKHYNKQIM